MCRQAGQGSQRDWGSGRRAGRDELAPTGGPCLSAERRVRGLSRLLGLSAENGPRAGGKTGLKRRAGLREKRGEQAAEKEVGRTGLSFWVGFGFSIGLGSFLVFFFPFLFLFQTPLKSILNSKEI